MTIPVRGIYFSQLRMCEGAPLPPSGHVVKRVQFQDKCGIKQRGFYKACDPTYPDNLARYVTMFSVEIRMAIADRASEEIPVFDENDALIGTFSVEIPNFKPMLSEGEIGPEDPEQFRMVCPDAATLVEYNIAEVLWARLRRHEDDLHEKNLGLAGAIDLDMLEWDLISAALKGARFAGALSPEHAFDLPASDLDTDFPCIKKTKPYYWPTHPRPKTSFNKCFQNRKAFRQLNNPDFAGYAQFQQQKYAAMLKELLMFDEQVLKERMSLYCEDEAFIKHCLSFFSEQQKEIYKKVVNEMPGFKEFIRHPHNLETALQWFIKANNEQYFPENAKYSIDKIKSKFLDIWKDCHVQLFSDVLKKFEFMADLPRQIGGENTFSFQGKEMLDEDFIQVDATTKAVLLPNNGALLLKIVSFNAQLQQIIKSFFDNTIKVKDTTHELSSSGDSLFYKESTITIERFQTLLTSLNKLLTEASLSLEADKDASVELKNKWNMALMTLEDAAKKISLPTELCALYATDDLSSILSGSQLSQSHVVIDETLFVLDKPVKKSHAELLDDAVEIFYEWLKNLTPNSLHEYATKAYKEYSAGYFKKVTVFGYQLFKPFDPTTYSRRRGREIAPILETINKHASVDPQSCDNTISSWEALTLNGGWEETSLNVMLMRELCNHIIVDLNNPFTKIKIFGNDTQFANFFKHLTPQELKTMRQRICDIWSVDQIKPLETKGDVRFDWLRNASNHEKPSTPTARSLRMP